MSSELDRALDAFFEGWPGRFTHHLELHASEEIDKQVRGWLKRTWEQAVWVHSFVR